MNSKQSTVVELGNLGKRFFGPKVNFSEWKHLDVVVWGLGISEFLVFVNSMNLVLAVYTDCVHLSTNL